MAAAKVVPPKGIPSWQSDQPRRAHLPSVPLRMVVAGPSGCDHDDREPHH
jgi:hypothetical protein